MACPSNSVKCSVSRKTTNDLINIVTVRRCYDLNGEFCVIPGINSYKQNEIRDTIRDN